MHRHTGRGWRRREQFLKIGMVPVGGTPEALRNYLKLEIARWAKVVKEAGVKPVE